MPIPFSIMVVLACTIATLAVPVAQPSDPPGNDSAANAWEGHNQGPYQHHWSQTLPTSTGSWNEYAYKRAHMGVFGLPHGHPTHSQRAHAGSYSQYAPAPTGSSHNYPTIEWPAMPFTDELEDYEAQAGSNDILKHRGSKSMSTSRPFGETNGQPQPPGKARRFSKGSWDKQPPWDHDAGWSKPMFEPLPLNGESKPLWVGGRTEELPQESWNRPPPWNPSGVHNNGPRLSDTDAKAIRHIYETMTSKDKDKYFDAVNAAGAGSEEYIKSGKHQPFRVRARRNSRQTSKDNGHQVGGDVLGTKGATEGHRLGYSGGKPGYFPTVS